MTEIQKAHIKHCKLNKNHLSYSGFIQRYRARNDLENSITKNKGYNWGGARRTNQGIMGIYNTIKNPQKRYTRFNKKIKDIKRLRIVSDLDIYKLKKEIEG